MKNVLFVCLLGLVACGCSRVSSEPRTTRHTERIKGQLIGREELVDAAKGWMGDEATFREVG